MQHIYTIKKGLEWERENKKSKNDGFESVEKPVEEITKGTKGESNSIDITKEKPENSSKKLERC